jgi:hypothetical protein
MHMVRRNGQWTFGSTLQGMVWLLVGALSAGCETGPSRFPVIDRPDLLVEVTAAGPMGKEHSHPFDINEVVVAKIFAGLTVRERDRILGFGIFDQKVGARVFSDQEVMRLAPWLAKALRLSSPWDVVSFYSVTLGSGGENLITSGGVFVTDNRFLHVLIANFRSRPSETASKFVTASELDPRHQPLMPAGRYRFRLSFEPNSVVLVDQPPGVRRWSYADREQALVIDLLELFPDLPDQGEEGVTR